MRRGTCNEDPRAILRAKEDEMAKRKSTEPEGLTLDQRRIATRMVIHLISKSCGVQASNHWAWEMTPMPAGWPSDEQLLEGLMMAARGTLRGPWSMPKCAETATASPR